ncbi:MAG: methyl-accepting chemotaxis protein [Sphingomonas paucimobilis]
MKNLKISSKLYVVFGILLGALFVMAATAVVSQHSLNGVAELLGKDRRDKLVAVDGLGRAASDYRNAEANSILSIAPADIANAEAEAGSYVTTLQTNADFLDAALKNPNARATFAEFKRDWTAYMSRSTITRQLARANDNDAALKSFRTSRAQFDQVNKAAADLKSIQLGLMDGDMASANATYAFARNTAIGLALAVGALAVALLVSLIRGIAYPLQEMTQAMGKLADGDLAAAVPVADRRDEVGGLATAMTSFRDQLASAEAAKQQQTELIVGSVGNGLDALARGDLTARINVDLSGPFAKLKDDFNNAMVSVAQTLTAVGESAEGITNGASDIRQASDDLSRRTEQQAASLEETAAAMHQITTTVQETAANALKANRVVSDARTDAEQSGEVVRRAVAAMNGIERTSNEISEIITVIDGIAFQTNLLALNAGVEAARAGDAGKGFAVVASEVRALAQRSADAAKDVKSKITASTEQVSAGVTLVAEAGNALTRITGRVGDISTLVSEITSAAEQQAIGLQQVNVAVGEMDGVTQQNAAMVEEATAAARSLAEETERMSKQVNRFKLTDRDTVPLSGSPVHQLLSRVARAADLPKPRGGSQRGNAAVALAQDDWSEF